MTAKESLNFIGKTINIYDSRTGHVYSTQISDVRTSWGKIQVQVMHSPVWFELKQQELEQINNQIMAASA